MSRFRSSFRRHVIITAALGFAVTTVGAGNAASADASNTQAADPALADDQNLVVRQYSEPVGFDPATLFRIDTEMIALNIYNGLTTFDPITAEPLPDLAESWTISEDGLVYTFDLVETATWQFDYGPFTSADVVYSYERVMDPATGSQYLPEFNNIASIEAPDDYMVVITLEQPDANFLLQVGNNHQGQIVNQAAIEEFGDEYPRHPVGTGPFSLEEWVPNSTLVLRRNDDYFKGPATLESITFELITDHAAAETALLNGEVDLSAGVGSASTETIERIAETPGFEIHASEQYTTNVYLFGPAFEPFQDVRVRRAFAMAIDNVAIVEAISPLTATAWSSILPPWMAVYDESVPGIEYDPEAAEGLLAEAGYADGFTLNLLTTAPTEINVAQQAYLADVGIIVEFDVVEVPVFNERRQSGDFDLSFRVYPAVNPDTLLFGYLHPDNAAPVGMNGFQYDDPELTALLESARAELDPEVRQELYSEAQVMIAEDVPYVASTAVHSLWGGRTTIENVQINRLAGVDFHPVYISTEE